jgi:hypothetical protein
MQVVTSKQAVLAVRVLTAVLSAAYKTRTVPAIAAEAKASEQDVITTARALGLKETHDDRGNKQFSIYSRVCGGDVQHYDVAPQPVQAQSSGSGCCSGGNVPQSRDEKKCAILEALKDRRWSQRTIARLAQIANTDTYTARQLAVELGARISRDGCFAGLRR